MSAISEATHPGEVATVANESRAARKRVVIIGAGFAGLAAAHALRHADVEVLLIDRRRPTAREFPSSLTHDKGGASPPGAPLIFAAVSLRNSR